MSGAIGLAAALLLVAGGGLSAAWWMRRRAPAHAAGRDAGGAQRFEGMTSRDIEALVAEALRKQGYEQVAARAGELMLRRERETYLLDCRHWQSQKVGVAEVDALARSMKVRGAGAGFMLSGGRFAREAITFAAACNVRLIDGAGLRGLVAKAQAASGKR
ncbi:MAG TPA: restriction endonuclease [Burkholderiaceae bacterium]|nr:restriction endonuclease [Burkholderiaceae bacterium]